ncbi:MAG: Hsp20/alpha crystallin family protein [Erysipelotrichaceae bacterium]|nr:Hsp20/alpha crystallin family protein [Erysipelotrichaceae bacterium]
MLMPSIFGESLIFGYDKDFASKGTGLMRTDVSETDDSFELDIDLPGFKKEDIKISFEKGYLKVAIENSTNNEENVNNKKYIRQERFYSNMSRSFYFGDNIQNDNINAQFEDGVLKITVPKKAKDINYIEIE